MLRESTGDGGWDPIGGVGDLINGVTGAVSYWSDPWTNTFKALQTAAAGLSRDVLPALTNAMLPDLSADWFIKAYQVAFATAIFVAVALLIPQIVRTARGRQAGRDLIESAGLYFGLFLLGAMFGPAAGIMLVNFFHSLSNQFVGWGVAGSVDGIVEKFQSMIEQADPVGISGGVVLAVLLMFLMLIGLALVMVMLLIQLVTLYFTGVLIPLGIVWSIDPGKRSFAMKLVGLWIGILAAHPLLFFLLGFAFTMMANSVSTFGNNLGLQSFVNLAVAVIALFVAALSPVLLLKFAPVIPVAFGGTNGPSLTGKTIGSSSMTDAMKKNSEQPQSRHTARASSDPDSGDSRFTGSRAMGPPGGLSSAAGAPAQQGASVAEPMSGAASTTPAPPAPAAAVASEAAAGATAASEGVAAAGAAESSTGAGAVIGIPTLIMAAGIQAASKGVELTEKAGTQAIDAMDEDRS